jgi:hypothetical protein
MKCFRDVGTPACAGEKSYWKLFTKMFVIKAFQKMNTTYDKYFQKNY